MSHLCFIWHGLIVALNQIRHPIARYVPIVCIIITASCQKTVLHLSTGVDLAESRHSWSLPRLVFILRDVDEVACLLRAALLALFTLFHYLCSILIFGSLFGI